MSEECLLTHTSKLHVEVTNASLTSAHGFLINKILKTRGSSIKLKKNKKKNIAIKTYISKNALVSNSSESL